MFYYPAVLKRHTGCFSTIWLVATKGIRVPRRDFLKVNVKSTCDNIMNYVLEQVPPPWPGLPRPRFSLYLSSQLQYGVVVVYHRQCAILLAELQSIVGKLAKQRTSQKIDLDDHSRPALDFPDALSLLEEAEGAPDPLFGVMYMQDTMPSPNTLIQMSQAVLTGTSPEHPALTSPAAAAAELQRGITASPDSITLREMEPVAMPITEFQGVELVDQHPDTIVLLLAQTDHFPEGDLEQELERKRERKREREQERKRERKPLREPEREQERGEREGDLVKERTKELTASTIELQPATLSSEDATLLPQEVSAEKPGPPADQLTPVTLPDLPSPPSAPRERERAAAMDTLLLDAPPLEEKTRRRRRRKRQLIFFDPETQISQEALQQQIDNPLIEIRRPLFPPSPSRRMVPAAELLDNPCTYLPEEVLFLWKQAATIKPLSGWDLQVGERGPESTDSEKEREREMVEAAQRTEAAEREEQRPELSPKEVPRDLAEAEMFDISAQGSLPLEASDQREVSREVSPMYTPEREASPVSRSVSTLQDIPEGLDELPERSEAESPGLLPELAGHEAAPVLFQSLLPPEVDRRTVSNIFQRLLEALLSREFRAEQDEPYGDIWILPGPSYDETQ